MRSFQRVDAAAGLAGLAELAELANFKRQLGIAFCQTSIWKKEEFVEG